MFFTTTCVIYPLRFALDTHNIALVYANISTAGKEGYIEAISIWRIFRLELLYCRIYDFRLPQNPKEEMKQAMMYISKCTDCSVKYPGECLNRAHFICEYFVAIV